MARNLNTNMNMKERMLAVLQGGELDRVPFVAYDGVTATNEEVWRALGDDEMGIIRWSKVHQVVHPDVRFESRPITKDGLRGIATAMYTASGHLTQEKFFDPIFNSASISKHYIESPDDYLIFREYLRACRVVPNDEGFLADVHDVGDRGFPMVEVTRTAYQQLWIVWASLFDLSMHFSDIPEIMEETGKPAALAIAQAAAIRASSLASVARTSSSPRHMPGNAKVLLIWLGMSGRPVANTATPSASLGSSSGFGMPSASTTGSAFMPATSSRDSDPGYDTPT